MCELAVAAVDVAPALEQLQDRPALCWGDGVHRGAARSVVVEAARASAVLPAAAPAVVELEHRASPRCAPAFVDGAVDEVQQGRFGAGLNTRGHAGGHPQRSFPSNKVTFTAISLSASPKPGRLVSGHHQLRIDAAGARPRPRRRQRVQSAASWRPRGPA